MYTLVISKETGSKSNNDEVAQKNGRKGTRHVPGLETAHRGVLSTVQVLLHHSTSELFFLVSGVGSCNNILQNEVQVLLHVGSHFYEMWIRSCNEGSDSSGNGQRRPCHPITTLIQQRGKEVPRQSGAPSCSVQPGRRCGHVSFLRGWQLRATWHEFCERRAMVSVVAASYDNDAGCHSSTCNDSCSLFADSSFSLFRH